VTFFGHPKKVTEKNNAVKAKIRSTEKILICMDQRSAKALKSDAINFREQQ
jgi:hypothetical protein